MAYVNCESRYTIMRKGASSLLKSFFASDLVIVALKCTEIKMKYFIKLIKKRLELMDGQYQKEGHKGS